MRRCQLMTKAAPGLPSPRGAQSKASVSTSAGYDLTYCKHQNINT